MAKTKVNFTFDKDLFPKEYNKTVFKKTVKTLADYVLFAEKCKMDVINILFCNDKTITEYNKKYLKHNYETDIITFKYNEEDCVESDIIISMESVQRNSFTFKSTFLNELFRVVIHGILHLGGMEDSTKSQKLNMRKKENFYLKSIGIE
ncbi:MAG: rRNA maturation RNase YbeY [Ignavibacteriota bacterium]|nr:rRNA maturation RNase YbeY [Ignavibacteriota bacterium]